MDLEELQEILLNNGIQVSIEKQMKILDRVNDTVARTNAALASAGLPGKGVFSNIEKIENDVSWSIEIKITESNFIN